MKITARKLLIMLLVVAMFLQPLAMTHAEAKKHHKHHSSNNRIVVLECKHDSTQVKFPQNHLTVKDSWTYIYDNRHGFLVVAGEYSCDYEIDNRNRLYLEFYPGDGVGNGYPGREYISKEHAYRIGKNMYAYGWIIRSKIKNYYRHHKHYIELPIESTYQKQKVLFVQKGKNWTFTAVITRR